MEYLGMPKKTVVWKFSTIDNNKALTFDLKKMSKVLKDFFSDLAESLLSDPSNKYNLEYIFIHYSNLAVLEVFHIKNSSEGKVFKMMENIKISKAANIYILPGRFLNDNTDILSKPINESFKTKTYFQKRQKVYPSNYRPISLLPLIWKIIKKVVKDQKNEFFEDNEILYNYPFGFRTNHSTNLFLTFVTDKILKGFNEGLLIGMILIDLQKSFNKILLKKLEAIGFSDHFIWCFRSYVCERILFIETKEPAL